MADVEDLMDLVKELRDRLKMALSLTSPRGDKAMWRGGAICLLQGEDQGHYLNLLADERLGDLTALEEIAAERRRHVEVERWTSEHDDSHVNGEMALAAAVYAVGAAMPGERERAFKRYWPWLSGWYKPRGAHRDLVRAGALIVAEIERLDRRRDMPADPPTTSSVSHFEVEVNVGRRGAAPVWRSVVDDDGAQPAKWVSLSTAKADSRESDCRVLAVHRDGSQTVVSLAGKE